VGKLPDGRCVGCNEPGISARGPAGRWQPETASTTERLQVLGLLMLDLQAVGLRSDLVVPARGEPVLYIRARSGRAVAILAVPGGGRWWYLCGKHRMAAEYSAELARELATVGL
jgi:hypothetical protein